MVMTGSLSSFSRARGLIAAGFLCCTVGATAADLTIHLADDPAISRRSIEYQCDVRGTAIGVPRGRFPVEYINAGANILAIVPIAGHTVIFSIAIAASGVRYTAQQYTWWDAKGEVTLSSQSANGEIQTTCHRAEGK
jgi:membrane-bound inhibitor of C-type lysozyme